jgi:hypothetical protein
VTSNSPEVPAQRLSDQNVFRVHIPGPDIEPVIASLREHGWELVSVELRPDDSGVYTVTVEPRDSSTSSTPLPSHVSHH